VPAVLASFESIRTKLQTASDRNQIKNLEEQARALARLRAFLYNQPDIALEFDSAMAVMQGWGVPEEELQRIKATAKDCSINNQTNLAAARQALYAVYDEYDSWDEYIDFAVPFHRRVAIVLGVLALLTLLWSVRRLVAGDVIYGFLLSGFTGACLSVISRLPPIATYEKISAEILSIVSRLDAGLVATIVGGGFLAMSIVSINLPAESGATKPRTLMTVAEVCGKGTLPAGFTSTAAKQDTEDHCKAGYIFLLLGIALLLGFSERALPSFEGKLFSGPSQPSTKPGS